MPLRKEALQRFYMARFPVTVAQSRVFISGSGREPYDPDSLQGLANHPVRYVTWYEAMAYGEWLTEKLKTWAYTPALLHQLLTQGWRITLPTEQQWEKAARGVDGRIYPWGNVFDHNKLNGLQTGIGSTSSVGCFPKGANPFYEVQEMSGNVWEWTRSIYHEDARQGKAVMQAKSGNRLVMRGGWYANNLDTLRCAYRYRLPYRRVGSHYLGFRVCVTKDV